MSAEVVFDARRRTLLRVGVAASVLAGLAGVGVSLTDRERSAWPAAGYRFLTRADVELFSAVMPVVLAGVALSAARLDEVLRELDALLWRAAPPAQRDLRKLLHLLEFAPSRWALAGLARPWRDVGGDEIARFLDRWRGSSFGLLNGGYRALVKLCATPYYGTESGYRTAGYPGPWAPMYRAINS